MIQKNKIKFGFIHLTAIGILCSSAQGSLLMLEDFGGTTGSDLNGQSYVATGMTGAWTDTTPLNLDAGDTTLTIGLGGGATGHAHTNASPFNDTTLFASRSMTATIDLSSDNTYYLSYYTWGDRGATHGPLGFATGTADTDSVMAVGANNGQITIGTGLLGDTDGLYQNDASVTDGVAGNVWTYAIARITASSTGLDRIESIFYDSTTTALSNEADITWAISHDFDSAASLDTLLLGYRDQDSLQRMRYDGIRLGESYADVTGVPEPSSAALLGLGGLALILRRRK